MFDKNYDGLVPDSAHRDKGTTETRGKSIYIWKAYLEQQKKSTAFMKPTSVTRNGPTKQPRFLTIASRSPMKEMFGL